MFERDAFDDALPFQPVEAVRDLMLVRHEQRPAPLQCDADLRAREPTRPAKDEPVNCAGDAAPVEHEVGNGCEPRSFPILPHDAVSFIISSSRQAGCSCSARLGT